MKITPVALVVHTVALVALVAAIAMPMLALVSLALEVGYAALRSGSKH